MANKNSNNSEIREQAWALVRHTVEIDIEAKRLGVKQAVVGDLKLDKTERALMAGLELVSVSRKKKLLKEKANFTVSDATHMALAAAQAVVDAPPIIQFGLLRVIDKLLALVNPFLVVQDTPEAEHAETKAELYQFKITLIDSKPAIWRRIQVMDCSLAKFHEYIQTAMGWRNCHLHEFMIGGRHFGDPENSDGFELTHDSSKIRLSRLMPKGSKRFAFTYLYDFGDTWEHKIVFEGVKPKAVKQKYPVCLEGERACPPENCGGVWGYEELLETLRSPEHSEHEEVKEWVGEDFDPELFDAKETTKAMHAGII